MRIDGIWAPCDDGVIRPLVVGRVETAEGDWVKVEFLIDMGADRTVLSNAILEQLGVTQLLPMEEIGGLGGITDSVTVETRIHFRRETGVEVAFRGQFAAVTNATHQITPAPIKPAPSHP